MGKGQLFAGNLASMMIAILGFLQVLSWTVAGLLIVLSSAMAVFPFTLLSRTRMGSAGGETVSQPVKSVREQALETPQARPEKWGTERRAELKPERPRAVPVKPVVAKEKPGRETEGEEVEREGPESIEADDYLSYDVELEVGDEVVGQVVASGLVNVYILTEENVSALEVGGEFWYEAAKEGVREASLKFRPEDEGGRWFLVVENMEDRVVDVTVKVVVNKGVHSVPFLRTEGLGLPDEKLDSKLQGKT